MEQKTDADLVIEELVGLARKLDMKRLGEALNKSSAAEQRIFRRQRLLISSELP